MERERAKSEATPRLSEHFAKLAGPKQRPQEYESRDLKARAEKASLEKDEDGGTVDETAITVEEKIVTGPSDDDDGEPLFDGGDGDEDGFSDDDEPKASRKKSKGGRKERLSTAGIFGADDEDEDDGLFGDASSSKTKSKADKSLSGNDLFGPDTDDDLGAAEEEEEKPKKKSKDAKKTKKDKAKAKKAKPKSESSALFGSDDDDEEDFLGSKAKPSSSIDASVFGDEDDDDDAKPAAFDPLKMLPDNFAKTSKKSTGAAKAADEDEEPKPKAKPKKSAGGGGLFGDLDDEEDDDDFLASSKPKSKASALKGSSLFDLAPEAKTLLQATALSAGVLPSTASRRAYKEAASEEPKDSKLRAKEQTAATARAHSFKATEQQPQQVPKKKPALGARHIYLTPPNFKAVKAGGVQEETATSATSENAQEEDLFEAALGAIAAQTELATAATRRRSASTTSPFAGEPSSACSECEGYLVDEPTSAALFCSECGLTYRYFFVE